MEVPSLSLIEKAKLEINEEELRKKQSLAYFREWIEKHPFLSDLRDDDKFLLQFLRTKKFSMKETFKLFENHFLFRNQHPEWFDLSEKSVEKLQDFIDDCVGFLLTKRDKSTGSYVAIFNSECFDLEKYSHQDIFHFFFTSITTCMEHEVNQILGYSCIMNFSNTPVKFFTSTPIGDLCEALKIFDRCPGRYKKIVVYGLPSVAVTLFNIAKSCMNDKQRSRLHLVRNDEELHHIFDKSILPERFGGSEKESEMFAFNHKNLEETLVNSRKTMSFKLDSKKASHCGHSGENIESFRVLEID